ncbi:mixed lineage kinase domain-like protein isoform X2 [Hyla sarda]|uniref:mixed lineage kinase domain-like protein isoform X2 n=1 Tax=Hyla sarda TaxID=327740 RepID=UPI0024C37F15|nr:mixed lineage kinase domain-like protein isoform X2 [Hyla sarda]
MEVVKNIFTVAKVIYDQCDQAQSNKKRCYRLKKRIELLLIPTEKLKNDPEKSKELETTLSALLSNLENAKIWVIKYSKQGWWQNFLQAGGIQSKYIHISDQLSDTAQTLQLLIQVEHRPDFLRYFNDEILRKQNLKDIEEDLEKLMPLIEREMTSLSDKVDSVKVDLQKLLQAEICRPWDIKEIRATDLRRGDLIEIPGMMTSDNHSLYLGEYHKSPVVIKVLRGELNRNDDCIRKIFQSESETMKRYESPNILRLYGICIDNSSRDPCYSLVMEYCDKGTLRELLRREPGLSWERRIQMSLDVARALYRLHQTERKAVLHGSLNSSKFLVDGMYSVKLSGFELSKTESSMRRSPVKNRAEISELVYIAPETLQNINAYDKCSEIYSLGVVILEIAFGGFPLQGLSAEKPEDMHQNLWAMMNDDTPASCPLVLRDVIKRCLVKDPEIRPSAGGLYDI